MASCPTQYQYSCPDFFQLGDNGSWVWMNLQSCDGSSKPNHYFTGKLDESSHKFVASASTPLFPSPSGGYQSFGHSIAKSGGGPNGRRLLWGAVCGRNYTSKLQQSAAAAAFLL